MSGISIDEELAARINGAFADKKFILAAYVDGDGQPKLSYRGSTQVFSPDQLAIWVRDPAGGLLANIGARPKVTLMYRDPPVQYMFFGRAWIAEDDATRTKVYDASAEPERERDAQRLGKAVIIDLDAVVGGSPDNRVDWKR